MTMICAVCLINERERRKHELSLETIVDLDVAYMDRLLNVRRTASAGLMHNLPKVIVVPDSAGDAS